MFGVLMCHGEKNSEGSLMRMEENVEGVCIPTSPFNKLRVS